MALHGHAVHPSDVDVLLDETDAARLLPALGLAPEPGTPDAIFHSAIFARWDRSGLPVDFMAGLRVRGEPVRLTECVMLSVARVPVPVPSRAELIALLHRFGRPKDLARAALLG